MRRGLQAIDEFLKPRVLQKSDDLRQRLEFHFHVVGYVFPAQSELFENLVIHDALPFWSGCSRSRKADCLGGLRY